MGKIIYFLCFILSVFPTDATENRRHVHVIRRGKKKRHIGDTVAKIWIEENGQKKIEIDWSELSASEEEAIIKLIDQRWVEINHQIDQVFAGEKVNITKITTKD